jgi:hypothetical protein
VSGSNGSFTVTGGHTYADEGSFPISVSISDKGGSTTTATASASIGDAALTAGTPVFVTGTEGQPTSSTTVVASFTDANTSAASSDFTAIINWGDGKPATTGTVSGSNGSFTVTGGHTYADEGSFPISVSISDKGGSTTTATASATVADADVLSGQGVTINASPNQALSNVVVANFADTYAGAGAGDFIATINWGDGTTTAGFVSGGNGSFAVSGTHTYTSVGQDTVQVTLADDAPGTAMATAFSTVNVQSQTQFIAAIAGLSAGFWAQHLLDWNGATGDDRKASNLVASGVLSSTDVLFGLPTHGLDLDGTPTSNPYYGQVGVLLGDANADGKTDNGETTLFVPLTAAQQIVNSSVASQDTRQILMRQAIAAQLNIDNGNPDPGLYPGQSAGHDLIDEAVKWLRGLAPFSYADGTSGNVDSNHDGILEISGLSKSGVEYDTAAAAFTSPALSSSKQAWQSYVDPINAPPHSGDLMVNGQDIKNALEAFDVDQLVTSLASFMAGWNSNGTVSDVTANTGDNFWGILKDQHVIAGPTHT